MSEKPAAAPADAAWPLPLRIAFRFFFSLIAAMYFPYPLTLVPWVGGHAQDLYATRWNEGVAWVGAHVLHLAEPLAEEAGNGSGDRLFHWVELGCFFSVALAGCAIWSVLDRKRTNYRKLNGWLMIAVRYLLIASMMDYGFAKVIKNQFSDPAVGKLMQRIGDLSPMGLLWLFMGSSTAYTFFAGFGELLGGVLLFFRRTTTLGALVIAGVMTNVVVLNFCYDVPVKIGSSTLLVMALYLVTPDLARLADVLLFNRPTEDRDLRAPYRARGLWLGGYFLKAYMAYALVWTAMHGNLERHRQSAAARGPADGYWKVVSFHRGDLDVPASPADPARWAYVGIYGGKWATLRAPDDSKASYVVSEGALGEWILKPRTGNPKPEETLTFTPDPLAPDHARITGTPGDQPLELQLERMREDSFLLVNRGFHWVNDAPLNR